ncbi:alpha/beta fold hydrolase [Aureimonas fodinaquatilis]|uniref:alpha/beta fold hydrolase n=1 Tax=Aureimonas fodinaquatilis TaxID=2565783 RepID=UPI00165D8D37|nr:alpha/beta hydrolase [Aureimonas fodinaquatilis]
MAVTGSAQASYGGTVSFTDFGGEGPALIFAHGWCGSQSFWTSQIPSFSQHCRVVTLDMAGSGASDPLPAGAGLLEMAQGILAVVDTLGLPQVTLIGHSMGGPVAVEAAIRLGARCNRVIGVDTFTDPMFYCRRPDEEIASRVAAFSADFREVTEAMVVRTVRGGNQPAICRWIVQEMCGVNQMVALSTLRSLLEWDIEERWPLLRCAASTINSAELESDEAIPCLSRLPVVHIAGSGHFPMMECPEEFNKVLSAAIPRR